MRVRANGITLNFSERGVGDAEANRPVLVFLHYFGGSSRAWTEVIDLLALNYRCIAVDLRGFGDSDAPAEGYAVSDYAGDVTALMHELKIERYALIGHSMGGKIALLVASQRPPELSSLVLVAPSPPTPEPIKETERLRLLSAHGDRDAAMVTVNNITAHPLPRSIFERTIEDNLRSSQPSWRAWLLRGSREDIAACVSRIEVPVQVIAGASDSNITRDLLAREIVARVYKPCPISVLKAKHLLPLEAPQSLANEIIAHLTRIDDLSHATRKN